MFVNLAAQPTVYIPQISKKYTSDSTWVKKKRERNQFRTVSYLSKPADLGKGELLRPFGMTVLYSGRGF